MAKVPTEPHAECLFYRHRNCSTLSLDPFLKLLKTSVRITTITTFIFVFSQNEQTLQILKLIRLFTCGLRHSGTMI